MRIPIIIASAGIAHLNDSLGWKLTPNDADTVLRLDTHFRDPHVDPRMRNMTGRDPQVQQRVLATPGMSDLIDGTRDQVVARVVGAHETGLMGRDPNAEIRVLFLCKGGRHRAPVAADILHRALARNPLVRRFADLRPAVHQTIDRTVATPA